MLLTTTGLLNVASLLNEAVPPKILLSDVVKAPLIVAISNVLVPLTVRSPVTATVLSSSALVDTSRTLLPVPACTLISSLKVTS